MDRLSQALAAADRAEFLPADVRERARFDGPLSIGHGQTNSQPRTVIDMLGLLQVRPGQTVLDVGAGSGWTTALLAVLAGPDGRVTGLELQRSLVRFGGDNLRRWLRSAAPPDVAAAHIERAKRHVLGKPDAGPYDRILVSAEAQRLPPRLVEQVAAGGRMVIPVAGVMLLVEMPERGGEPSISEHGFYRFVPLRE